MSHQKECFLHNLRVLFVCFHFQGGLGFFSQRLIHPFLSLILESPGWDHSNNRSLARPHLDMWPKGSQNAVQGGGPSQQLLKFPSPPGRINEGQGGKLCFLDTSTVKDLGNKMHLQGKVSSAHTSKQCLLSPTEKCYWDAVQNKSLRKLKCRDLFIFLTGSQKLTQDL